MSNGTKSWNEHQIKGQLQKARETLKEAEKRLEYFRDLQYEHPEPVIWDAFDDACMVMIEEALKETEEKEG